jgi:hypothetical protein
MFKRRSKREIAFKARSQDSLLQRAHKVGVCEKAIANNPSYPFTINGNSGTWKITSINVQHSHEGAEEVWNLQGDRA